MQRGFSLVELSIVLVILGLLTGGILAGQSLIRAAELRAVTTEVDRYVAAINSFRDKYFAAPGDMTNATKFWGDQASGTGACPTSDTDGTPGTCNGNGDGIVYMIGERHRAWQQLAMAGLIEGSYTGIPNVTSAGPNPGENAPRSKISNAGWDYLYYSRNNYSWSDGSTQQRQELRLGVFLSTWTDLYDVPVLKPEEMWNLDTKMDDGKPALGKAFTRAATNCTTALTINADYLLSEPGKTCGFIYTIGQ